MTPHTVDLADLLANVPDGVGIDMPGPEGGWAVAVIAGRVYRARVGALDDYEQCLHEWICRPESDTWFCEWCGEES